MPEMQLDLHCHTDASFDSRMKLEKVVAAARSRGLDALAITDHNTYSVARDLPDEPYDGLHLIRGMEIGTDRGDVLALFLDGEVDGREFTRVVDAIHEQSGLAILAHPFKWRQRVSGDTLRRVDGIEVYNARGQGFSHWSANQLAYDLWRQRPELIPTAGSDAHLYAEIGRGRIELEVPSTSTGLKELLAGGGKPSFHRHDSSLIPEARSQLTKLAKRPGLKQFLRFGRHVARTGLWTLRGAGKGRGDTFVPLVEE